jgi:phosphatase NudJ
MLASAPPVDPLVSSALLWGVVGALAGARARGGTATDEREPFGRGPMWYSNAASPADSRGGDMPREPIPTWCFALVVVRKGDRFLLVQESKYGEPWYLPAGRVEAGESFADAAVRETREEAGIPVRVTGVIRVEYSPSPAGARMRVIFLAEPTDDTPPKTEPDDESLGARWVALDELPNYTLRGAEVTDLFGFIARGGTTYPPELLQPEDRPYGVS